ncbi:MAG TPA: 3-dehydroquinate synthase [Candidatus Acidoferrales bacterium]|nr:3-dehydroquinate synthase [Candidatus Acidoferrales bacterium]
MSALCRILVRVPSGSYRVLCGEGILARAGREVARLDDFTGVYVLSAPRVWRAWGRAVQASLRHAGGSKAILFDDRESAKNMGTAERLCRRLVRAGADRRAVLVAVGGGVVGDVAGFVAASYLRGVELVHVPTTLVAQVDSAIGGKTGVNLPEGKNLIGAFYQPRLVLADPALLATLPFREYRSGLYEVIKYGVIRDARLFAFLERHMKDLLRRRHTAVAWALPRCIRAKAEVVSRDEREAGPREILNFGHTFAHALETITGYRRYLHGEAVGWGMMAATWLAAAIGRIGVGDAARILRLVARVGPLPPLPPVRAGKLLRVLRADKKSRGGHLRFLLPRRIGRAEVADNVPEPLVRLVWSQLLATNISRSAPGSTSLFLRAG